jgi:hypothetical protein
MKKLFYLVFFTFLISCAPKIVVNDNIFDGDSMFNSMKGTYSKAQFDSMCVADTLPIDLLEWETMWLKEYETGSKVVLYSIYKKNVVYRVEKTENDSIKITKRQVK